LAAASKSWDKDKEANKEENFAEGEDEDELELATLEHIVIRYVRYFTEGIFILRTCYGHVTDICIVYLCSLFVPRFKSGFYSYQTHNIYRT
jgi:hypothetical protein